MCCGVKQKTKKIVFRLYPSDSCQVAVARRCPCFIQKTYRYLKVPGFVQAASAEILAVKGFGKNVFTTIVVFVMYAYSYSKNV